MDQLKKEIPIQYLLGTTHFYGLEFEVNPNVLIPRPETEELVEWIVQQSTINHQPTIIKILDIGTGSGCIAISLAKNLPNAGVFALDVSEQALATAQRNAESNQVAIQFIHQSILETEDLGHQFDIIVSNPPYIPIQEKVTMEQHVVQHEPDNALFVPNDTPLVFYQAIAHYAMQQTYGPIAVYCELHQDFALQTKVLFENKGYHSVNIFKDIFENWRMLRAIKK